MYFLLFSPVLWCLFCCYFFKFCQNLEFFAWVLSCFLEARAFSWLSFFSNGPKKACINGTASCYFFVCLLLTICVPMCHWIHDLCPTWLTFISLRVLLDVTEACIISLPSPPASGDSRTSRLALDLQEPTMFSMRQVNRPESSVQLLVTVRLDSVSVVRIRKSSESLTCQD